MPFGKYLEAQVRSPQLWELCLFSVAAADHRRGTELFRYRLSLVLPQAKRLSVPSISFLGDLRARVS